MKSDISKYIMYLTYNYIGEKKCDGNMKSGDFEFARYVGSYR